MVHRTKCWHQACPARDRLGVACLVATALILASGLSPESAHAYKPESPQVKAMLDKALDYLMKAQHDKYGAQFGGKCLIALAAYKHTHDANNKLVAAGVDAALRECARGEHVGEGDEKRNYNIAVALMLLCEVDPAKYGPQIQLLTDVIVKLQRREGGYSYHNEQKGDTSQTQYAILALWTASQKGANVPEIVPERAANWLIRTQDLSGGWGYLAEDPGGAGKLLKQSRVTPSMGAAGLGTLLIAADMLRFSDPNAKRRASGQPAAVRAVESESKAPPSANVDISRLLQSIDGGERWTNSQPPTNAGEFIYYYMYAVERYQSFIEKFRGLEIEEPDWYNQGVELLKRNQKGDGSWPPPSPGYDGTACDTALAMLYLLRSTKKMIQEARDGVLIGGSGLPTDVSSLRTDGVGRIVKPEMFESMEGLIGLLSSNSEEMDALGAIPDDLPLDPDPEKRKDQYSRLRRMAESGEPKAREVALKVLAKSRDFDNIPWLIYGLTDPDDGARQEAIDGLRFMTRKFRGGFAMPDNATEDQRREVANNWKAWYRSLRPDIQFIEE